VPGVASPAAEISPIHMLPPNQKPVCNVSICNRTRASGVSMRIEGSLAATRITRERDGTEYAQSTIPRVKLEYQPRRSFFLRLVTEYRFEQRDALYDPVTGWPLFSGGDPISGQESNGLRADVLVSFEPTPGTVAFFGYGASLAKDPLLYMTPGYTRTTDGFFVKLAYVFRK